MAIRNFFRIMTQGPPNPGFMQEKVQKGDFLKKPSRELKFCCCFMNLSKAWNTKLEAASFLLSKNLYNQCERSHRPDLVSGAVKNKLNQLLRALVDEEFCL